MALLMSNATLTAVAGATGDEWEGTGAEQAKWTGRQRAYWQEERRERAQGDESRVDVGYALVVPAASPVAWQDTDLVTVAIDGAGERRARVIAVRTVRAPGVPQSVQTTKLELEPL